MMSIRQELTTTFRLNRQKRRMINLTKFKGLIRLTNCNIWLLFSMLALLALAKAVCNGSRIYLNQKTTYTQLNKPFSISLLHLNCSRNKYPKFQHKFHKCLKLPFSIFSADLDGDFQVLWLSITVLYITQSCGILYVWYTGKNCRKWMPSITFHHNNCNIDGLGIDTIHSKCQI